MGNKKTVLFKDQDHYNLTIEADENGYCITFSDGSKTYDKVKIYLKDILDDEIQKWIDTGKAMDKAGAYGIQDEFSVFIDKIEGNYTTAVGLPIHKLYDIIKKYE